MKYSIAFFLAATNLATAQMCLDSAQAIPACGIPVLESLGSKYGCSASDYACQCSHSSDIANQAIMPALHYCSRETALSVSSAAVALRSCVAGNTGSGSGVAVSAAASATGNNKIIATKAAAAVSGAASATGGAKTTVAKNGTATKTGPKGTKYSGAAPAATAGSVVRVGGALGLFAGAVAFL